MRRAYGDESADETGKRVFAIGGLFGTRDQWIAFKTKWRERTGGKIFHATDCDTDHGKHYPKKDHNRNKQLYADLTQLVARSGLIGRGLALDLKAYNELLAPQVNNENPYHLCFQHVVIYLARQSAMCIPRDRIKFTFDRNHQVAYDAGALYRHFMNHNRENFEYKKLMDEELSFATKRTIGIQAADLIAREAMKVLDNRIGPVSRSFRVSAKVLWEGGWIKFRTLNRSWCHRVIQEAKGHRYLKSDYFTWLEMKGLNNTLANRLRYERSPDYDYRQDVIDDE